MATESYNRANELKQFYDSKLGIKGLVDSGITTIPRFLIQPSETLSDLRRTNSAIRPVDQYVIPTIDLSGVDSDLLRPTIIEKVARASRELGFFQVVNHGIGVEVLDRMIGAMKGFHDQMVEVKASVYRRHVDDFVTFFPSIDIFPGWRDTLRIMFGPNPTPQNFEEIPKICRSEALEWDQHVTKLGEVLMGLLCDGLGVKTEKLKEMTFLGQRSLLVHCYPYCPQPDLIAGTPSHTDATALTILLQDHIGGLQVKYGEEWVDVKPIPGALVINIGDALQIMSNDEYKSGEHRALANVSQEPRISAAVFFNPSDCDSLYGPFPELISSKKPARFRQFTFTDYKKRFLTQDLDGKTLVNYYRHAELKG